MLKVKIYSEPKTEQEKRIRKAVLNPDRLAVTPAQEVEALHGNPAFRLEPLTRREKRAKKRVAGAKGRGFTQPMRNTRKQKQMDRNENPRRRAVRLAARDA